MINRDDMLELTRRMTPARTCFDRIAGAYINDMGEVEDSFNIHFQKRRKEKTASICCFGESYNVVLKMMH